MKFTEKVKEVKEFAESNKIPFGAHKVQIGFIELGETDSGKEYMEFTVLDEDEREETARMWFTTEEAGNFSFNVCRQIYVHNAPEDKKEAARETMDAVASSEELYEKLCEKLIGGQAWFTKYVDPKRTYTDKDGNVRPSVNKNIMGYEPKLKPELMPRNDGLNAINDVFPGAQEVPFESAGDAPGSKAASGIPKAW